MKEQKVDNKQEHFLSVDEIKALLSVVEEEENNLYLFTLLSLSTGGRLNTIRYAHLYHPKSTKSQRY